MAIRTVLIEAGKCAVFPSTADIISITSEDGGIVQADCSDVPDVTDYVCWKFTWSSHTFDDDATFSQFILGNNTYQIPSAYKDTQSLDVATWIDNEPLFTGLVVLSCTNVFIDGILPIYSMKIQVPQGIAAPEFRVYDADPTVDLPVYLRGVEDDNDCTDCT